MLPMSKKSKRTAPKQASVAKSLTFMAAGVLGALAIAAFLSQGAEEAPETTGARQEISTAAARIRGPENATLKLVEFGDYQCPSCRFYHGIVTELFERFPDQLALEFHHFPLASIHHNSVFAAVAAESAGEQNRFWEMHDLLFDNQDLWANSPNPESVFISFAAQLGLDQDMFMQSLRASETESRVLRDVTEGRELQINAVPAFFLDGRPVPLPPNVEEFERLIYTVLESR